MGSIRYWVASDIGFKRVASDKSWVWSGIIYMHFEGIEENKEYIKKEFKRVASDIGFQSVASDKSWVWSGILCLDFHIKVIIEGQSKKVIIKKNMSEICLWSPPLLQFFSNMIRQVASNINHKSTTEIQEWRAGTVSVKGCLGDVW